MNGNTLLSVANCTEFELFIKGSAHACLERVEEKGQNGKARKTRLDGF